jgi:hypothetical protein
MLRFEDSHRESVIDYLQSGLKIVNTPTRLLNNSNEFLPIASLEINKTDILTPRKEFSILKEKLQQLL